jgi:acetyl-CoA carboxylase biotin carboxyl carrier protein
MMEFDFVEKLIRALDESSLDSLEIERGGTRIRLAKTPDGSGWAPPSGWAPAAAPAAPAPPPAASAPASPAASAAPEPTPPAPVPSNLVEVTSPMVGTFYRASSPESPPFVETGSRIATGDTLCIIEAMKLMNELEAEVEGTVREVLVQNGEPVEYGQVLFRVEPG